jgi:transposase
VKTGEDTSLIAPYANTECMNTYLKELSKDLGDKEAYVILDQAGWHRSAELKVPSNIELVYLPPYSPELNPVERFWQYLKNKTIKNVIFETLEELEKCICMFFRKVTLEETRSICSNYLST